MVFHFNGRRCDILPGAFTYDNLIAYLQGYVDYFDCDRCADKELKQSKDIWDGTVTEWIWEKLYEFALENPRDDPERVLHEWYQKMFKNYKLADGSEKMRGVYFEAIRIIDTIREELWEGYRE